MKWFNNMRMMGKMLCGFILVAALAGVVGIVGIVRMDAIGKETKVLVDNVTLPIDKVTGITEAFHRMRVVIRDAILADSAAVTNSEIDKVAARKTEIEQLNMQIKDTWLTEKGQEAYKSYTDNLNTLYPLLDRLVSTIKSGDLEAAVEMLKDDAEVGKAFSAVQDSIGLLGQIKAEYAVTKSNELIDGIQKAIVFLVVILIVCVLFAVGSGIFISISVARPLNKAVNMIKEMSKGHLGQRLRMETKDEIGIMSSALDEFAEDLQKVIIAAIKKMAEGELNLTLTPKDGQDEITPALNSTIESLKGLVAETAMLSEAAVEGRLGTRGNAGKFSGAYREIVTGVNNTLEAIVQPLNVALGYISKMADGENLEVLENSYKGDYAVLIGNLTRVRSSLYALLDEAGMLTSAAARGELSYRADVSKLKGGYADIVKGVNNALDSVIEPVKEASAVLQEMSKGNLQVNVRGNYLGDHAIIKDALNDTINTIRGYVGEISEVLTEMAGGNLVVGITADYRGDFVEIKNSLNNIVKALNEVLGDINSAADQVASGARQVSEGSQALSQGATEQASSIEELSASITQIAAQTRQNAINANQANELALNAKINAAQGNEQMKEMLKSMVEINSSSANISKIIKVIDEIAFQTNILALNAAVEAARAGQHGKGFAVVAEEVRNLAARSANAAKETTTLIEGSINKVEAGTKIANETAEALDKIVTGVDTAANLVGEIASASNEQASGIAQINKGIEQVSQVVQTNSATAQESAAASEELSGQSELLKDMVGRFKLLRGSKSQGRTEMNSFEDARYGDFTLNSRKASAGIRAARTEAAAGKVPKISLNEREFGKY